MAGKGAPKGNKYSVTHGLALVRNQIKRRTKRGRSYVDKRTHEGQEALRIQAGLVDDQGGVDAISAAKFIVIQELTQLYYLGAMMDHATAAFLRKNPQYKNPRALSRLFSYRMPLSNTIAKYLDVLGLDKKPPPAKTLEELFDEDEEKDGAADEARG
jgi:hypothetical protein